MVLRGDLREGGAKKNVLPGSRRGPKSKQWTKTSRLAFGDFFAKRSEALNHQPDEAPLHEATGAGLKWLFSSFGEEPTQVAATEGAPVRNIILGITGALVALGVGQEPGDGLCHSYWAVDDVEVPEGTAQAVRRVRGGTGDLQLRRADGALVWCTAHHYRPWRLEDGELMDAATAPPPLPKPPPAARPPSPVPPLRSASPVPGADTPGADEDEPPIALPTPATVAVDGARFSRALLCAPSLLPGRWS